MKLDWWPSTKNNNPTRPWHLCGWFKHGFKKNNNIFLMLKPHKLGWPFLQILGCSRGAPWARRSSRLWRFNRLWTGDVRPRFRAGKAFHFMVIMVKPMAILNWASKQLSLPLDFGMFLLPFGGSTRDDLWWATPEVCFHHFRQPQVSHVMGMADLQKNVWFEKSWNVHENFDISSSHRIHHVNPPAT